MPDRGGDARRPDGERTDAWSDALQRLIGAGHAYADVLNYTLAQMEAFVAAADRQESMRLTNLLAVIATGSQGSGEALRKMARALSC